MLTNLQYYAFYGNKILNTFKKRRLCRNDSLESQFFCVIQESFVIQEMIQESFVLQKLYQRIYISFKIELENSNKKKLKQTK